MPDIKRSDDPIVVRGMTAAEAADYIDRLHAEIARLRNVADDDFHCGECGHMKDAPMHQLGCTRAR